MHSVAFVPQELWHLHRYICYEERVIVYALCGICVSRALSYVQYRLHLSCWTYAIYIFVHLQISAMKGSSVVQKMETNSWRFTPGARMNLLLIKQRMGPFFYLLYPRHQFTLLLLAWRALVSVFSNALSTLRDQKFVYLINYSETGKHRRLCPRQLFR